MVVPLDQATKSLAVRLLPAGAAGAAGRPATLRLVADGRPWLGRPPALPAQLALWSVALACTVLVLATGAASPSHGIAGAGLVMALAGATSNLLDRLARGAVVDFIALGWWPAFNLADAAIVAGVAVAVGSVV